MDPLIVDMLPALLAIFIAVWITREGAGITGTRPSVDEVDRGSVRIDWRWSRSASHSEKLPVISDLEEYWCKINGKGLYVDRGLV